MANKKPAPKPPVAEIVDDIVVDDVVETIEPEIGDSPGGWVEPSAVIRDRLEILITRRGPRGGFREMVELYLNGKPTPSSDDEWLAFQNSLER